MTTPPRTGHDTCAHTRAIASFPTQVLSSRDGFLADTSFLSHRLLGWYLPRECRELPGEFTLVPGHEIFISTAAKRREEIKDKQKGMGGKDIMLAGSSAWH